MHVHKTIDTIIVWFIVSMIFYSCTIHVQALMKMSRVLDDEQDCHTTAVAL